MSADAPFKHRSGHCSGALMVRKQANAVHLHRSRRAPAPVVAALRRDGFGKLGLATSKSLPAQRDASPQEGVVEVAKATNPVAFGITWVSRTDALTLADKANTLRRQQNETIGRLNNRLDAFSADLGGSSRYMDKPRRWRRWTPTLGSKPAR